MRADFISRDRARLRAMARVGFALTRDGALSVARTVRDRPLPGPAVAALALVAGSILIGLGVGSAIAAGWGLPPYDVLLSSIDHRTPLSHGQSGWLVAAVLGLVATALGSRPRASTIALVVLNGLTIDAAIELINPASSAPQQLVLVVMGVLAVASGVALVVFSGLAGGMFELLMDAGERRGANGTLVRTVLEVSVFAIGAVLGGHAGPATLAFALTIGPSIRAVGQALADYRTGRELRLESVA